MGSPGLTASANFTNDNGDLLTFGFNDPWQYYSGGGTYFETTNPKLFARSTPTLNPKIPEKALLWTKGELSIER
ncbi:hypothetical protein [Candidatus Coxiella mudrowiae]|uniref:hypothetical protein n=1 Tax=Candidatus Coxiella mudrowiae TaxID=2054173 RepID=UPI00066217BA|nr:hypothetical protein [Candidatus Coxiella mudrowiae]